MKHKTFSYLTSVKGLLIFFYFSCITSKAYITAEESEIKMETIKRENYILNLFTKFFSNFVTPNDFYLLPGATFNVYNILSNVSTKISFNSTLIFLDPLQYILKGLTLNINGQSREMGFLYNHILFWTGEEKYGSITDDLHQNAEIEENAMDKTKVFLRSFLLASGMCIYLHSVRTDNFISDNDHLFNPILKISNKLFLEFSIVFLNILLSFKIPFMKIPININARLEVVTPSLFSSSHYNSNTVYNKITVCFLPLSNSFFFIPQVNSVSSGQSFKTATNAVFFFMCLSIDTVLILSPI